MGLILNPISVNVIKLMINIGIVGYGYWGPNLVRNFMEVPDARVTKVCDLRPDRLEVAKSRYPSIEMVSDYRQLLTDPELNAVAISTPISSHFDLALEALRANKHILVEKPLTNTSEQAKQLIIEAKQRNRVLMVDHTFVYTGAVRKIREFINNNSLGDLYYYDSTRVNLGLFQHDANVIWDLAVHDIAIIDYLCDVKPKAVSATGMSHIPGEPENVAYITLFFDGDIIGHINVNWLAPVKVRRTLVCGSKQMIVYDDLEPSEKIKIYDKGVTVKNDREQIYQMLISYRTGDMLAPQLNMTEALKTEALHFLECIKNDSTPITDGEAGLRVIKVLEAATKSMNNKGSMVEIEKEAGQ
jgi:predicted dehydrogenase